MKVTIQSENLDINSIEEKELILRGVELGTYNYATYSKINLLFLNKGHILPSFENYICGVIYDNFEIPMLTASDVEYAKKYVKDNLHITLIDWINMQLEEMSKEYED